MQPKKCIIWQDEKTGQWIVCNGIIGFYYTVSIYNNVHDIPQENRLYRVATPEEIEAYNNDPNNSDNK